MYCTAREKHIGRLCYMSKNIAEVRETQMLMLMAVGKFIKFLESEKK